MVDVAANFTLPSPALVIDGSGRHVFAGVLGGDGAWLARTTEPTQPLEGLFPATEKTLDAAGMTIRDLRAFVYNRGPGSVLGLRLCAMAIETWRRVVATPTTCHAYDSLHLSAALLLQDRPDLTEASIVSEWKQNAWHFLLVSKQASSMLRVVEDADLSLLPKPLFHLPQRKGWHKPTGKVDTLKPRPDRLPEVLTAPGLLQTTDSIELHQPSAASYQKWTASRHR